MNQRSEKARIIKKMTLSPRLSAAPPRVDWNANQTKAAVIK
jgi:hypothetical protein